MDAVLKVQSLSKNYLQWSTPVGHVYDAIATGIPGIKNISDRFLRRYREQNSQTFVALDDISFSLGKGEVLGILGRNGAGKSTLLGVLADTIEPTSGSIYRGGRIQALLELGAGFNPDFSGLENVEMNGALLGYSGLEVRAKLQEIESFAEIGDYFRLPVRTYSSGMFMRLAFAASVAFEPEILIIDEALSVGDVFFQQKCFTRLKQLRDKGISIIFVSHDLGSIRSLCDRALFLHKGKQMYLGSPVEACDRFLESSASPSVRGITHGGSDLSSEGAFDAVSELALAGDALTTAKFRHGTRRLELMSARISNPEGSQNKVVPVLGQLRFSVLLRANDYIREPQVGLNIHDRFNNEIFSAGNKQLCYAIAEMMKGDLLAVEFDLQMSVAPGEYVVTLIASETAESGPNSGTFYDVCGGLGPIVVYYDASQAPPFNGMVQMPMKFVHHELKRASL